MQPVINDEWAGCGWPIKYSCRIVCAGTVWESINNPMNGAALQKRTEGREKRKRKTEERKKEKRKARKEKNGEEGKNRRREGRRERKE